MSVRCWIVGLLSAVLLSASAGRAEGPMKGKDCPTAGSACVTPVAVPSWVVEKLEEKSCRDNDYRTLILPPIRKGEKPHCEEPPDEARILRAMPPIENPLPGLITVSRDNIQIVTERIVDKINPPRFFPLVGPAQLHHSRWKCTVYYCEIIESSYPLPFRITQPRAEEVYIDLDHLHLVDCAK